MLLSDLVVGLKELKCGIDIGHVFISLSLYADDIVLLAPSEEMLQTQLNFVSDLGDKWKMSVNEEKQVMHLDQFDMPLQTFSGVMEIIN